MTIDLTRVGEPLFPAVRSWDDTATMLYTLGVGATEPRYATENSEGVDLVAIPTMAVTLRGRLLEVVGVLGELDPATILHVEERVELHRPLPTSGEVSTTTRIAAVHDKDPHALAVVETTALMNGTPLFTTTSTLMLRGAGGFGGDRGPAANVEVPTRTPDEVLEAVTRPDQALLYRLTGDRNPLHSDPVRAARAGFPRPILHGLCTLGAACVGLIRAVAGDDPRGVAAVGARFSSPVFPGETLRTEVFCDPRSSTATFRTYAGTGTDARLVLDRGTLPLRNT